METWWFFFFLVESTFKQYGAELNLLIDNINSNIILRSTPRTSSGPVKNRHVCTHVVTQIKWYEVKRPEIPNVAKYACDIYFSRAAEIMT